MSIVRAFALILSVFAMALAVATPMFAASLPNTSAEIHIATGSVTFVNSSTLVIHQIAPYSGKNMTFVIRPSTEREGELKVGSTVTVQYENEPDHRIATMVEVEHAKVPPSTSPSH